MKTYLEVEVPEELCQHLFTSFKRKICQASPEAQRQSPGVPQLGALGEPPLPPLLGSLGGDTVPVVAQGQGPWWGRWVQPQQGCHSLDPCCWLPPALLCSRKDGAFPRMGDPGGASWHLILHAFRANITRCWHLHPDRAGPCPCHGYRCWWPRGVRPLCAVGSLAGG